MFYSMVKSKAVNLDTLCTVDLLTVVQPMPYPKPYFTTLFI